MCLKKKKKNTYSSGFIGKIHQKMVEAIGCLEIVSKVNPEKCEEKLYARAKYLHSKLPHIFVEESIHSAIFERLKISSNRTFEHPRTADSISRAFAQYASAYYWHCLLLQWRYAGSIVLGAQDILRGWANFLLTTGLPWYSKFFGTCRTGPRNVHH